MGQLEVKRQDLVELYQLLEMYQRTYRKEELTGLLEEIQWRYEARTGMDIRQARNPRGAGRKAVYQEGENQRITKMRKEGYSLRQIARETSCSVGHVQDVISRGLKQSGSRMYGN